MCLDRTWWITSQLNRTAAPAGQWDAARRGAGWLQKQTDNSRETLYRADWWGGGGRGGGLDQECVVVHPPVPSHLLVYTERLFPQRCWASRMVCLTQTESRRRACSADALLWYAVTCILFWQRGAPPPPPPRPPPPRPPPWRCRKVFLPPTDTPLWHHADSLTAAPSQPAADKDQPGWCCLARCSAHTCTHTAWLLANVSLNISGAAGWLGCVLLKEQFTQTWSSSHHLLPSRLMEISGEVS